MWPHKTAGDGSRSSAAAELWPNLPKDLLSEVYARLDAPLDRVCFAATCPSWRAFASTHLPWLILDPSSLGDTNRVRCYCPQDGTVLPHVPFPIKDTRRRLVGCHNGGWVVSYEASSLRIVDLFSGEVAPSEKQRKMVRSGQRISTGGRKIIFSEPPTSSACILAAITYTDDIAVYRLGRLEAGWTTQELNHEEKLIDIAFYNRELYGLTRHTGTLIKIKISVNKHDVPVIMTVLLTTMPNQYPERRFDEYGRYIIGLPDKLMMVTRNRRWGSWNTNRPFFTVLELVEDDTGMKSSTMYKWVEATSLDDHALFLGWTCSKAVRGVKKNHIYYSHHSRLSHLGVINLGAKVLPTNSGDHVYYKEDETMGNNLNGITSEGYYVCGAEPPMWLLPPDI